MNIFKISSMLLLAIAACTGVGNMALADQSASQTDEREFIELFPSDIKAPFTQETVTKLNEIVRRSYDAINEYDDVIEGIRVSVKKASSKQTVPGLKQRAEEKVEKIYSLDEASKTALTDMVLAAKELRGSDEVYNAAILEGMMQFVEEVEREISTERNHLDNLLESAV